MSSRDFDNYKEIFNLMDELYSEGPDLLIYSTGYGASSFSRANSKKRKGV